MPPPLPADAQPAQQKAQCIELVQMAVVHHVLGPAAGTGVGLVRHLQRVEGAGDVLPLEGDAPVEVLRGWGRRGMV